MIRPRRYPGRQAGQGMVELVVVTGVTIALFLGIWYLGKFQDIQASTIQAARYAAWERTVHLPGELTDSRLEQQTRARFFGWDRNPYRSTDGLANGSAWTTQSAMWLDHNSSGRLIKKPQDVTVGTTSGALPGKLVKSSLGIISGLDGLLSEAAGGEKLNPGGYYQSVVNVNLTDVASLPAPLNKMQLKMHETYAIATDSWDASGAQQVAMRTRAFTPAAMFKKIDFLLGPAKAVLHWIEPSFSDFNPGQICPDIVPADRLDSGVSKLPVYSGGGPCF